MTMEIGEFIASLRNKLAAKLTNDEEADVMPAFDRACVEVLVQNSSQNAPQSRARGSKSASAAAKKAWATRRKNKAAETEGGEAA